MHLLQSWPTSILGESDEAGPGSSFGIVRTRPPSGDFLFSSPQDLRLP